MQPKVSVIIPVYNAEKYLKECLDSVVGQTLQDIEIICVDAGSTDSSAAIIAEYQAVDSRVVFITDKGRLDAGSARNIGMEYASGKYLSILDADDFFEKDMLETAYIAAENNSCEIVVFDSDIYIHSKKEFAPHHSIKYSSLPAKKVFSMADTKGDIFGIFKGWAWDKLILTSFIKENDIKFQQQRTTNDMFFVFAALAKADRISVIKKVMAHYRREAGSLSVTRELSWHCFYDALVALKTQLEHWNLFEKFQQDYVNYSLHFSLWHLNTLKEPTHTLLYNKLREEWYENLGVTKADKSYFYNPKEYLQYQSIMTFGADEKENLKFRLLKIYHKLADYIKITARLTKENGLKYTWGMFKREFFK